MRLQYADFIRKGEGLTESPAIQNLLDAEVMYMTVISETDPDVTVEVMTGNDLATGTWIAGTILEPDGTKVESVSANGIYSVPLGGVRYVRVKNGSADTTLEVYASFSDAVKTQVSMRDDVKNALLGCFDNVAWATPDGQNYYDALSDALTPDAELESIAAVYTQTATVDITDPLSVLRDDLVVTANYNDGTSEQVYDYQLSGTLTEGTSTITVTYGGKSATFDVTVTDSTLLYKLASATTFTGSSSEVINTGVALFPTEDRDITILMSVSPNGNPDSTFMLYGGNTSSPYNALSCWYTGGQWQVQTGGSSGAWNTNGIVDNVVNKMVFRKKIGNAYNVNVYNETSGLSTGTPNLLGYISSQALRIGGARENNTSFKSFKGTIYECMIYARYFSDDEVNAYLGVN